MKLENCVVVLFVIAVMFTGIWAIPNGCAIRNMGERLDGLETAIRAEAVKAKNAAQPVEQPVDWNCDSFTAKESGR